MTDTPTHDTVIDALRALPDRRRAAWDDVAQVRADTGRWIRAGLALDPPLDLQVCAKLAGVNRSTAHRLANEKEPSHA